MPAGVTLIGYADDVGIMVTAKIADMLEVVSEHALHNIMEWLDFRRLRLAPHKIEAVLLISGRKTKDINIRTGVM